MSPLVNRVEEVGDVGEVEKVGNIHILSWHRIFPFTTFFTFFTLFTFPTVGQAEDTSSPSLDIVRRTVSQADAGEGWQIQFGPRAGMFLAVNKDFRDTYGGSAFLYGMSIMGFNQDWGFRVEVETSQWDRLLPFNEAGKWRNVQSGLSLTPFWFSALLKISPEPWMTYVGLGGAVMMASERFRGDTYVNNAWSYSDFTNTDTLFGGQLVIGLTRGRRFGLELKYSVLPRRGATGFADLGGLSTALSWSF